MGHLRCDERHVKGLPRRVSYDRAVKNVEVSAEGTTVQLRIGLSMNDMTRLVNRYTGDAFLPKKESRLWSARAWTLLLYSHHKVGWKWQTPTEDAGAK